MPGRRRSGLSPIAARLAAHHLGQVAAVAAGVAARPSDRAAIRHRQSPGRTATPVAAAGSDLSATPGEIGLGGSAIGQSSGSAGGRAGATSGGAGGWGLAASAEAALPTVAPNPT